jgi:hypothetical protein
MDVHRENQRNGKKDYTKMEELKCGAIAEKVALAVITANMGVME